MTPVPLTEQELREALRVATHSWQGEHRSAASASIIASHSALQASLVSAQEALRQTESERDEALEIARALRESQGAWDHSDAQAEAADGFDAAWAKYRCARDGHRWLTVAASGEKHCERCGAHRV